MQAHFSESSVSKDGESEQEEAGKPLKEPRSPKAALRSPTARGASSSRGLAFRQTSADHDFEFGSFQQTLLRAESEMSQHAVGETHPLMKALIVGIILIVFPLVCRMYRLDPAGRCSLVIASMLLINLWEVMQLYCTALLIPVLGTLYGVLGEGRSIVETSTLLVRNIFNNTSFMVLGALVINGIFTKCGLDRRFMALLLQNFLINGSSFLLMMMLGGTLMCSVLYSGSLVLLAALQPVLRDGLRGGVITPYDCKRILLGVAFCSNAGSALLPISSPVNLITVSLLGDFDYRISLDAWVSIALPTMMLLMTVSWACLQLIYHSSSGGMSRDEAWAKQLRMLPRDHVQLTDWHLIFMGVGTLAVLGITVYATQLEPIIGHSACLSLGVVVVVFGSGFMTKEEFNNLDWDILALVGGTNVMAFLVRETGLGMKLSDNLMEMNLVESTPYQLLLIVATALTVVTSALLGHSICGVLLMPLVIAVGIKLKAAEETAILLAIAIPCGMHFAHSSFDNVLSMNASKSLGRRSAELRAKDFRKGGLPVSATAVALISTVGYRISNNFFGAEPRGNRHEIADKLVPKVAKENARVNAEMALVNATAGAVRGPAGGGPGGAPGGGAAAPDPAVSEGLGGVVFSASSSGAPWEALVRHTAVWATSGHRGRRKLRAESRQMHAGELKPE